jgi:hypothetical protein
VRKLDDLYAYKHSIVDDLYIKTADDNYVAARWCFYGAGCREGAKGPEGGSKGEKEPGG